MTNKCDGKMIDYKDITVIVQGAVDKNFTPACLSSIRKYLPGAGIILSTWEGSDVSSLKPDILLLNKDPGGFADAKKPKFTNNLLRLLVSTQNALKVVNTKYVLKIRTDLFLKSNKFLRYWKDFNVCNEDKKVFENKVITTSFFSKRFLCDKKGKITMPAPFHTSDWFVFGETDDIKRLYMISLPKEPEQSSYFVNKPFNCCKIDILNNAHQYTPEQYITYNSYKLWAKGDIVKFDDYLDYNNYNIQASEEFIINNFKIFSPQELDFICLKKNTNKDYYNKWCKYPFTIPYFLWNGLYRPYVYRVLYKQYCDPGYKIPLNILFKEFVERLYIAKGKKCIIR